MNTHTAIFCALLASCASTDLIQLPHDEPTPSVERLENGLTIITLPGLDAMGLFAKGAPEQEPIGLEGLTPLLVEFAMDGTQSRRDDLPQARALALHARLEGHYDGAILGWHMQLAPTSDRPSAAELLLEIAFEPSFPGSSISSRAERRRDILLADPDAAHRAATRWAASLALNHGRPLGLTPTDRTLSSVNRESLIRLHRRLLRPSQMVLVLDSPAPGLRSRLEALSDPEPGPPLSPCKAPSGNRFVLSSPALPIRLRAQRVPGLGMPGRRSLDESLARLSLLPVLPNFEIIDLGAEAAIVYRVTSEDAPQEDLVKALSMARRSLESHPAARGRSTVFELARDSVYPRGDDLHFDLGALPPPIEVELGSPSPAAGTLPVDRPRCRR